MVFFLFVYPKVYNNKLFRYYASMFFISRVYTPNFTRPLHVLGVQQGGAWVYLLVYDMHTAWKAS